MKKEYQFVWFFQKCSFFLLAMVMLSTICFKVSASPQSERTGNFNVFLGSKYLSDTEWPYVDVQAEAGIKFDFRKQSWPINLAAEYLRAEDDYTWIIFGIESKTTELNIGVRKIWEQFQHVRPFIGGGISFINGEFTSHGTSDDDSSIGVWFGGGVYWTLKKHFNIGLEIRESTADVDIFGKDVDAGGSHFGVLVGYHW